MCKTKTISIRVDEVLYARMAKSPVGMSEFVRHSVIQSLEGDFPGKKKNPGTKADDHIIQDLRQKISQLKRHQDHCNDEIRFLRDLHQQTMD